MKPDKPTQDSPAALGRKSSAAQRMEDDMNEEGIRCWRRLLIEIPLLPMADHLRRAKEICGEMCTHGSVRIASVTAFIFNYHEFVAIHYRLARAVQPIRKIATLSPIAGVIVLGDEKRSEHAEYLMGKELIKLLKNDDLDGVKKIRSLIRRPCETHRNYQIWVAIAEVIKESDGVLSKFPDRADVQRWIAGRKDPCFVSMHNLDSKGWDRLWEDSGVNTGTNAISEFLGMDLSDPAFSDAAPLVRTAVLDPGVRGKARLD